MINLETVIYNLGRALDEALNAESEVAYDVVQRAREDLRTIRSKIYEIL